MKLIRIQSNFDDIYININHIICINDYMDKYENDNIFTRISLIDGTVIETDELIDDVINKIIIGMQLTAHEIPCNNTKKEL